MRRALATEQDLCREAMGSTDIVHAASKEQSRQAEYDRLTALPGASSGPRAMSGFRRLAWRSSRPCEPNHIQNKNAARVLNLVLKRRRLGSYHAVGLAFTAHRVTSKFTAAVLPPLMTM